MKLRAPRSKYGVRSYCAPSAISSITGVCIETIEGIIKTNRLELDELSGYPKGPIKSVWDNEIHFVLDELGYDFEYEIAAYPYKTVKSLVQGLAKDSLYLLYLSRHVVAYCPATEKYVDGLGVAKSRPISIHSNKAKTRRGGVAFLNQKVRRFTRVKGKK